MQFCEICCHRVLNMEKHKQTKDHKRNAFPTYRKPTRIPVRRRTITGAKGG